MEAMTSMSYCWNICFLCQLNGLPVSVFVLEFLVSKMNTFLLFPKFCQPTHFRIDMLCSSSIPEF